MQETSGGSRQVAREVRQHFGERVLRAMVPRNVRISESPSYGQPVVTYDPTSQGSLAYRLAAREIETMTTTSIPTPGEDVTEAGHETAAG